MRADGGIAGLVSHLDGFQSLRYGADLVQLDEDGVAGTQLDALGQTLGVGDEQVVAHQLDLAAQLAGHLLPAFPVLFVQTVLDGDDGVLLHQLLPVCDELTGGELGAGLGQLVEALALGALPLGGGSVHGQHEVPAGKITGLLDGGQNGLDGLLVAGQVGSEAALVAHGGSQTLCLQDGSQSVEDLSAPAQALLKGRCAHGHDHELLGVHGVGGVCAAVQDVHHGDGQAVAVHAAEEAVEGHVQRSGSSAAGSDGNGQNGVCAQLGLVLGAVGVDHGLVDGVDVGSIHADDGISDDGVDVLHSLGDALAQIAALVAVAQLQRFELAGGCAGRCAAPGHGAVGEGDLSLNSGVAAGVQDLTALNVYDLKIVHDLYLHI